MFCVEIPALASDWISSSCGAEDLLAGLTEGGASEAGWESVWNEVN